MADQATQPKYTKVLYTQPDSATAGPLYNTPPNDKSKNLTISPENIGKGLNWDGVTLTAAKKTGVIKQTADPAVNTDLMDIASIVGISQDIASMSANLAGNPDINELFMFQFTDNGTARAIAWGSMFNSTTVTLPVVTVPNDMLRVLVQWNKLLGTWDCISVA